MNGFLNLNKPFGFTSHDCVARVRRLLHLKRVGHGGTLDPTAIGVLPIAVGRATRLLQYLSHDKAYRATVRFGVRTATDDMAGEVLLADPCPQLTLPEVQKFLPQFLGKIQQIPPSYSAIQVGGKRLYELARAGEAVEAPVRTVEIFEVEVLDWRSGDYPELDVAIACGTGTYIRAIARDLGDMLGVGGTLSALERTLSSGFSLPNSLTLETLAEQVELGTFEAIAPDLALQHIPQLTLAAEIAKRWCQGQKIEGALFEIPARGRSIDLGFYQIRCEDGNFLGIGEQALNGEDILLIPKMVWAE